MSGSPLPASEPKIGVSLPAGATDASRLEVFQCLMGIADGESQRFWAREANLLQVQAVLLGFSGLIITVGQPRGWERGVLFLFGAIGLATTAVQFLYASNGIAYQRAWLSAARRSLDLKLDNTRSQEWWVQELETAFHEQDHVTIFGKRIPRLHTTQIAQWTVWGAAGVWTAVLIVGLIA